MVLFVVTEFGATSAEIFDEDDLSPCCPPDNVESIAFIESDCLPETIPDGGTDANGKFVNGARGA